MSEQEDMEELLEEFIRRHRSIRLSRTWRYDGTQPKRWDNIVKKYAKKIIKMKEHGTEEHKESI